MSDTNELHTLRNNNDPVDPRNDEDYDTWTVGMEPLPHDTTWKSKCNINQTAKS